MAAAPGAAAVFGEEEYVRQGKPMFGKIWTFQELQSVVRPGRSTMRDVKDIPRPDNFPQDTDVDRTTSWVFWLPEGWLQGIRTNPANGNTLKCYLTPEGKRFWHKKDIEKFLGRELPKVEPKEKSETDGKTRTRYVTDSDAIPSWPEDAEDWLPKDWKLCYRQLPSGLHKVYIPPGVEDGFLYHRESVIKYLSGEATGLSPMRGSRPMSEIMKESATKQGREATGDLKPKAKRFRHADATDYQASSSLGVARLPSEVDVAALRDAGAEGAEELAESARQVRNLLRARGFEEQTELLCAFRRDAGASELLEALAGVYYQLPAPFVGRPCFQSVRLGPSKTDLVCRGVYLRWSERCARWQFGALSEEKDGVAISAAPECAAPWDAGHQWSLLSTGFGKADAAEDAAA